MIEGTKKFSQMNAKELQFARADLQYRLQSTLRPSKVIKLTDEGVTLQGGTLEGVYDAKNERLRVRGTNSSIGEISVAQLSHAQNVIKRFYARANGIDMSDVKIGVSSDNFTDWAGGDYYDRDGGVDL